MESIDWIQIIFGMILGAIAAGSFGIGLWGLVKKRPLVIANRPLFLASVVIYVLGIFLIFVMSIRGRGVSRSPLQCISFLEAAVFLILLLVFERQMSGYVILGITDEIFHAGLVHALNKLNLPHEETISRIHLTGTGADLLANVEPWSGAARVRIRQREFDHIAGNIIAEMKDYFKDHVGEVNNRIFILWLLTGVITTIVAFLTFAYSF